MLERVERITAAAARALCLAAAVSLALLMVVLTVIDVVLRQFGGAVPGAFELVTLGMRIAVPLALPWTFWTGWHVAVELLTDRLTPRAREAVAGAGLIVSAGIMALITWASGRRAHDAWVFGDVTVDLGFPLVWYWVPLLLGTSLSVPVALVVAARHLSRAIRRGAAP